MIWFIPLRQTQSSRGTLWPIKSETCQACSPGSGPEEGLSTAPSQCGRRSLERTFWKPRSLSRKDSSSEMRRGKGTKWKGSCLCSHPSLFLPRWLLLCMWAMPVPNPPPPPRTQPGIASQGKPSLMAQEDPASPSPTLPPQPQAGGGGTSNIWLRLSLLQTWPIPNGGCPEHGTIS